MIYTINSETCDRLPVDAANLQTNVKFPVDYGTTFEVFCNPTSNNELRGDNVITCDNGESYTFNERPKCNDLGRRYVSRSDKDRLFEIRFITLGILICLASRSDKMFI